jgi:hypothetical protein
MPVIAAIFSSTGLPSVISLRALVLVARLQGVVM